MLQELRLTVAKLFPEKATTPAFPLILSSPLPPNSLYFYDSFVFFSNKTASGGCPSPTLGFSERSAAVGCGRPPIFLSVHDEAITPCSIPPLFPFPPSIWVAASFSVVNAFALFASPAFQEKVGTGSFRPFSFRRFFPRKVPSLLDLLRLPRALDATVVPLFPPARHSFLQVGRSSLFLCNSVK